MAKPEEIFPSSYRCACGHVSDLFENTIKEVKAMSMKKKVWLGDSARNEHGIVFYKGEAIEVICPNEEKAKESLAPREGSPTKQETQNQDLRDQTKETKNTWIDKTPTSLTPGEPKLSPRGVKIDKEARFTEKQGQYLAFIYNYSKIHWRAPAEAELERYFKATPPTIHQMILKLEEEGLISRVPGQPRSIRLLIPPEQLPMLK